MNSSLRNVELRKLPYGFLSRIIDILEIHHDWKIMMSGIPRNIGSLRFEPKYNNEHVRLIENESILSGRKCTAILLEEWGTSGQVRPTLSTLQDVLVKHEMYRAADEISFMLHEPLPKRPTDGPAASIDTDVSLLLNDESIEQQLNAMDSIKNITNMTARSNDYANNRSTAQIKSDDDLIKFSHSLGNKPNDSIFTPSKKKPLMNENSNLIKFSQSATNMTQDPTYSRNITQTTPQFEEDNIFQLSDSINSADIPKFSALFSQNKGNDSKTSLDNVPDSNTDISISSYMSKSTSQYEQSASVYQMSFPNIDVPCDLNQNTQLTEAIFEDSKLINFKYKELELLTNYFSEQVIVGPNGITGKIGIGGFGEVFVGVHSDHGTLAVKKAHSELLNKKKFDITLKLFNAEVKYLSQFRHENIVPLLGYSRDGPAPCIVCEFIDGGSLEQKIAAKVLNEKQRINIMFGTAEGLKYLHKSHSYDNPDTNAENAKRNNFVHGDIKSANILLTINCVPKLCDFGLAKQHNDTTFMTTSPMGTSAYMAPEGFSGTITQKIDIYSFGVVILELLTGLRSIVIDNKEQINIKDYVEENLVDGNVTHLLDPVVERWTKSNEIYELAKACLERNRKRRLAIEDVCDMIYTFKRDDN